MGGIGHEPISHRHELHPPALASATQLQACVSHITLFAPKSYGNLDKVWAFAGQRGGELFMIRRREFIAGLGGAAVWPIAARAQQRALPVIGYIGLEGTQASQAFLKGLAEAG